MSRYENTSRGALIARLESVEAGDAQLRAEITNLGAQVVELIGARSALARSLRETLEVAVRNEDGAYAARARAILSMVER